jgi:hypothetical protein
MYYHPVVVSLQLILVRRLDFAVSKPIAMSRTDPLWTETKSPSSTSADGKSAKRVRFRIVSLLDMTESTLQGIHEDEDGTFDYSSDSGTFIDEDSIMTPDHTAFYFARGSVSSKHASPLVGSTGAAMSFPFSGTFNHTISPPLHWKNNHDTMFSGDAYNQSAPKIPSYTSYAATSALPTVALQSRPLQRLEYDFVSPVNGSNDDADSTGMWIDIGK